MDAGQNGGGDNMDVSLIATFPGEYATTLADVILAVSTDDAERTICDNCPTTFLNGNDRFDTFTYSFLDRERENLFGGAGHLGGMSFGPNIKIFVQVTQTEASGNAGDMDAIVTFFVAGPDADDVTVTVFEDQANADA